MLSFGARALPSDLALEASDTLTLYKALVVHKNAMSVDIDALEPTTFFRDMALLRQSDIIRYEAALKYVLSQLAEEYDSRDPASPLYKVIRDLEDPELARTSKQTLDTGPSVKSFRSNLIHLVADLHVCGHLVGCSRCLD
jgi:hypothetical protein